MRFTLSNLLLSLALFPLLIQGAPLPQGIKIHSTGPVVLPVLNSGEDGGKSRFGVEPEIPQRDPASSPTLGGGLGAALGSVTGGLGSALGSAAGGLGAGLGAAAGGLGAGLGAALGGGGGGGIGIGIGI